MPRPEVASLKQYAVLWPFLRYDEKGEPVVSSPIEIRVRWLDAFSENANADEGTKTSSPTIEVDREIAIGGILWKGRLTEVSGSPSGLVMVIGSNSTPDIKGRFYARSVSTVRWKRNLPTIA